MNIVNLLHIGDKVVDMATLSPEEKREIAIKLNKQALEPLGYKMVIHKEEPA